MYQAHFGLKKGLFDSGIAQEAAVYLSPKHESIVANCKIALTTLDSAVVLTGPAGVGKTTLAAAALRESSTRLALGWLNTTPANASELLELLLSEFGMNAARTGRVERLQMWRQFLNETNATDSRVFVIAEHAEDFAPELLRALETLTAADPNGCAGANIVLLGRAVLAEQLKSAALESLSQRIRLRQRLAPLTVDELHEYLDHHVRQAGGVFDNVFDGDAVSALHKFSGGLPRLANNLCETALTLAATQREQRLTAASIDRIAIGMFGMEPTAAPVEITGSASVNIAAAAAAQPSASAQTLASVSEPQRSDAAELIAASVATPASAPSAPQVAVQVVLASTPPAAASAAPQIVSSVAPQPAPSTAPQAASLAAAQPASFAAPQTVSREQSLGIRPVAPAVRADEPRASVVPAPRVLLAPRPAPSSGIAASLAYSPPRSALPPPRETVVEYDGSETDIADEILGDITITDTPEVQMMDFPVLTDEVEAPTANRAERSKPAARSAAVERAKAAPASSTSAGLRAPAAPVKPAAPSRPAGIASTPPAKPAAANNLAPADEEDQPRQTQTMHALASAKSIDDISNSMAETLFSEADLDILSAALSAGWSDADDAEHEAEPSAAAASVATREAEQDPFDLFDLGPDAPLELIDDSANRPLPPNRKIANDR